MVRTLPFSYASRTFVASNEFSSFLTVTIDTRELLSAVAQQED